MTKTSHKLASDGRSIQEVMSSMEASRLSGGGYLAQDILRLIGDPARGLGLTGKSAAEQVAQSFQAAKKKG
jgi:hypothetical protein